MTLFCQECNTYVDYSISYRGQICIVGIVWIACIGGGWSSSWSGPCTDVSVLACGDQALLFEDQGCETLVRYLFVDQGLDNRHIVDARALSRPQAYLVTTRESSAAAATTAWSPTFMCRVFVQQGGRGTARTRLLITAATKKCCFLQNALYNQALSVARRPCTP